MKQRIYYVDMLCKTLTNVTATGLKVRRGERSVRSARGIAGSGLANISTISEDF